MKRLTIILAGIAAAASACGPAEPSTTAEPTPSATSVPAEAAGTDDTADVAADRVCSLLEIAAARGVDAGSAVAVDAAELQTSLVADGSTSNENIRSACPDAVDAVEAFAAATETATPTDTPTATETAADLPDGPVTVEWVDGTCEHDGEGLWEWRGLVTNNTGSVRDASVLAYIYGATDDIRYGDGTAYVQDLQPGQVASFTINGFGDPIESDSVRCELGDIESLTY